MLLLLRRSLLVPSALAIVVLVAIVVGYRYADLTHHRRHRPALPSTAPATYPGTTMLVGTLIAYNQRVMSVRTDQGLFGVVLAQSTVEIPSCGRPPTLRPGERLELRVPAQGNGILLAATIREVKNCAGRRP